MSKLNYASTDNPCAIHYLKVLSSSKISTTRLVDHPAVTCSLITSSPATELLLKILEPVPKQWTIYIHNNRGITLWDVQVELCKALTLEVDNGTDELQYNHPLIFDDEPGGKWEGDLSYGDCWSFWKWLDVNLFAERSNTTVKQVEKCVGLEPYFYIVWI